MKSPDNAPDIKVGHKTPDEIKEWLGAPVPVHFHRGDPEPHLTPLAYKTLEELFADALALIQQLESDKQQLEGMLTHMNQLRDAAAGRALKMEERVQQLEAERDAAVKDLQTCAPCRVCKFRNRGKDDYPCCDCGFHEASNFEWRGVQKEDDHD